MNETETEKSIALWIVGCHFRFKVPFLQTIYHLNTQDSFFVQSSQEMIDIAISVGRYTDAQLFKQRYFRVGILKTIREETRGQCSLISTSVM
jgi:hypothetical protein